MTLLSPTVLVLAALAIPVVLFYLVHRRPQQRVVSSTVVWRLLDQPLPHQMQQRHSRFNPLLLLTLLALAALVLALAQPAVLGARTLDGDLVLIVDRSYAMQAHDVLPSRFSAAIRQARALADRIPPDGTVTVIAMDAHPRVVTARNGDRAAIGRILDTLQPGTGMPNLPAALRLAASLDRGTMAHAVVLTDRASGISQAPPAGMPVEIDRLGGATRDAGVESLAATLSHHDVDVVLRLRNQSPAPLSTTIRLAADGQLADVRPVRIAAGGTLTQVWTHLPATIHTLHATVVTTDDLALDRSAWAVVPHIVRRVLLVGDADYFLRAALALDPSVHLTVLPPGRYAPRRAAGEDLVVFDGLLPPALPPAAALLVAPPAGRLGTLRLAGSVAPDGPLQHGASPVLRYLDLSQVHLGALRRAALPARLPALLRAGSRPVIAAGLLNGRRAAVLLFDPQRSDWPLRPSFPILIHALVRDLSPPLVPAAGRVGRPLTIAPRFGVSDAAVIAPNGTVHHLRVPGTFTPQQPGLYTVRAAGVTAAVAVDVTAPTLQPVAGRAVLRSGSTAHLPTTAPVIATLTWPLVLAGILLLSAEWVLAARQ